MSLVEFQRKRAAEQAKPRKRPGLFQQLVRLPAEAGRGLVKLGVKTAMTPVSAGVYTAKNIRNPAKLAKGWGDFATAGLLTEGGGGFEEILGGKDSLLPGFLGSVHQLGTHAAHPTQYYRSLRGKEGSPDFLPLILGDIGTAAIVAGGTGAALGRGAKLAAAAGNVGRAERLATVARGVQRAGAIGGEVADLGIPRLGGTALRKILPDPTPEMIAEAAGRGKVPSMWAPAAAGIGRRARRAAFGAAGPGEVMAPWRARLAERFPRLLTEQGREWAADVAPGAAQQGGMSSREVVEPLRRAYLTPTREASIGGKQDPVTFPRAGPRPPTPEPVPPGTVLPTAPGRRAPSSRRQTVPIREGYDPETKVWRGVRDTDTWEVGPGGELLLRPQYQDTYAGGRGAVSFGETPQKSVNYAFEKQLGSGAAFDNLDKGVMLEIDRERLGLPHLGRPDDPNTFLRGQQGPALISPYHEETAYVTEPGYLSPVRETPEARTETQNLTEELARMDVELPDWRTMSRAELIASWPPRVPPRPGQTVSPVRTNNAVREWLHYRNAEVPDLVGVAEGRKAAGINQYQNYELIDVDELRGTQRQPVVVPKGAWRTMGAEELPGVLPENVLPDNPQIPPAQLAGIDFATLTDAITKAQEAMKAIDAAGPGFDLAGELSPILHPVADRLDQVAQSWRALGETGRAVDVENVGNQLAGRLWDRPAHVRDYMDGVISDATALRASQPTPPQGFQPMDPATPFRGNPLHGQGGYQRPTEFGQAIEGIGRGAQRTTFARPPRQPPPPPPSPVLGPGPTGPNRPPVVLPRMPGGRTTYDEAGQITNLGQQAAMREYTGGRGISQILAEGSQGWMDPSRVTDVAVPLNQRVELPDTEGVMHPQWPTVEANELAIAAATGQLPPAEARRLQRLARNYGDISQTQTEGALLGRGRPNPLDPSQTGPVRGPGAVVPETPMPLPEVVDVMEEGGLITFEEAQHLRGFVQDPQTQQWISEGLPEDVLRQRRTEFYQSDPRFMGDHPVLQQPAIWGAAWRPHMATARQSQSALGEQITARNQLLADRPVFGGPLETPRLPTTPMQLAAKGGQARYVPSGLPPDPTVGVDRILDTADKMQGRLPLRSAKELEAEFPVGPTTIEPLAQRLGGEIRRAEMSEAYTKAVNKAGTLGEAYMHKDPTTTPKNQFLSAGELAALHDEATQRALTTGTYQLHYNDALVRLMEQKGYEPWPVEGALGKELTMADRTALRGKSRDEKGNASFNQVQVADINADTPWLRKGLRNAMAPYITPRVPGGVISGINKINQVFKGVTLAPNVRWQIGDAMFHYLMAQMEGIPPWEFRRYINKARELGGRVGDMPRGRERGRKASSSLRYGGSEVGRRLYDSAQQMNLRLDSPITDVRATNKVKPGMKPLPGQKVTRAQKIFDPTTGRFKDASFNYNQVSNSTRREAMVLIQLDKRLKRRGYDLDDPQTLERLADSSSVKDREMYDEIVASIDRTNKIFGNTDKLAPFERDYLTSVFPFWTWTSTVGRLVSMLAINHPSRLLFTMWLGSQVANDPSPDLPGYPGSVEGPGGYWPTAFMNPFADIAGLPGLEEGGGIGIGSMLRSASPALKLPAAFGGFDVGQGQYLSRAPGTGRRDPYGREGYTPIFNDLGAMAYQTLAQVPMGKRVLNALPRATIPLPGTDLTTGNVVRYDTGESMGFNAGTPLPTRLGSLVGLPLPQGQARTAETERLVAEREREWRSGARGRRKSAQRRRRQTERLPRI